MAKITPDEQLDAVKKAMQKFAEVITTFTDNMAASVAKSASSVESATESVIDSSIGLEKSLKEALNKHRGILATKISGNLDKFTKGIVDEVEKGIAGGIVLKQVELDKIIKAEYEKSTGEKMGNDAASKKFVKTLSNLIKDFQDEAKIFSEAIEDLSRNVMKPFDKLIGWIEKLPGGKFLSAAFDLDGMQKDIRNKIRDELKAADDAGVKGFKLVGEAGKSAFKNIGNAIMKNPMLLVFGAVSLLLYGMIKLANRYLDVMKGIRDQTGLTGKDAAELAMVSRDIAEDWSKLGLDMEAAGKAAGAIVNEFQYLGAATKDMVEGVGAMVGILGVSEQSAAKVARLFEVMGDASGATVLQMTAAVSNASKLGGVAPAKVFEDMAQSTKEIQTYFKGSYKEAAKAAIELRRMGTSLKEASASAKSMVDFESSIGSELEASVLLGRQLDFGAARYYAFMGDIENQQKEVLKQVGSLEEFNRMMPFQKEALAKAAGMEVDQLGNMLKQQKILATMDSKQKQEYKDSLELLENMRDVDAEKLLSENKSLIATEQLKKMWDNILMSLSPILDLLYMMTGWIAAIIEKSKTLGIGLMVIGAIVGGVLLKAFTSLIGKMSQKISGGIMDFIFKPKVVEESLSKVGSKLQKITLDVDKTSKSMKTLGSGGGGGWGLAKAAVGILIIAGAIWVLGKALQEFKDVSLKDIGMMALSLILLIVTFAALGLATKAVLPFILTAAGAMLIIAGAIWVLGKAMQEFATAFKMFGEALVLFKDVTFSQLAGIAGGLVLIGLALATFGMTGLFGMFGLLQLIGTTAALKALAQLANPLDVVATSIERLGEALKVLNSVDIDVDKLEDIADLSIDMKKNEAAIVNVGASDNSGIVKKLDQMIDAITSMKIVIDGRELGEVQAQNTSIPGLGR